MQPSLMEVLQKDSENEATYSSKFTCGNSREKTYNQKKLTYTAPQLPIQFWGILSKFVVGQGLKCLRKCSDPSKFKEMVVGKATIFAKLQQERQAKFCAKQGRKTWIFLTENLNGAFPVEQFPQN